MKNCCKLLLAVSTLLLHIEMSLSNEWGECSRTCGTGISYTIVPCRADECTGTKREYRVCNTEKCPTDSIDFRTEQCQKIKEHSVSFSNPSDPCKLMCGLPGELPVEKGTVVDGTPCGVSGVCVAGTCIPVGCDGVLGSDKRIDNCGRCDVTEGVCLHVPCNTVKADKQENESHIKLPVGSTHVKVYLSSAACNFVALQNKTFYFNHTPTIAISGNKFELGSHKLTADGPLSEEILIQVGQCRPNEIQCKYYIPLYEYKHVGVEFKAQDIQHLAWVVGENYTECSQTCGTGVQMSEIYCKNTKTQKRVESHHCKNLQKDKLQPVTRQCSNQECVYEWKVNDWAPCSKSCGGGIRRRDVACIQGHDNKSISVNSTACHGIMPDTEETCNNHFCYNHWHTGPYGCCSNDCGEGIKRREVICLNAHGKKTNDSDCSVLNKPGTMDSCIGDMCTYKWMKSNWSNCSVACGEGIQTRTVECYRVADNAPVNESLCTQNISTPKPKTEKSCKGNTCVGEWLYDNWGKCAAPACYKAGDQHRNVYCYIGSKIIKHHADRVCTKTRPDGKKSCKMTKGCPAEWIQTFDHCTRNCKKIMKLHCMKEDQVVNNTLCPDDKPSKVGFCNSTCDDGCNRDGSCFFACNQNTPACVQASKSKNLDDPSIQRLLCALQCCTCRKFQEVST